MDGAKHFLDPQLNLYDPHNFTRNFRISTKCWSSWILKDIDMNWKQKKMSKARRDDDLPIKMHVWILITQIAEDSIFDVAASTQTRGRASHQAFHPDLPGLQCYSCGSLLNPNKKCDEFSRTDTAQVQTCLKDEACLMYSWKKSSTETATLRECFPTRVLLGTIRDPLAALPDCSQRDITDDGTGSIFACLCNTDFCNDDQNGVSRQERPSSPVKRIKSCPEDFDLVDGEWRRSWWWYGWFVDCNAWERWKIKMTFGDFHAFF